ncbi:MAG: hypothetical protein HRT37_02170 [Alteromonadaceae bacterium]|nr:hypothetical protein [Alteromonadaceae bacterium]
MNYKPKSELTPGWVGGFRESNPAFDYPTPDLTSLPMPDNMFNIDRLQREQDVKWPEFSWQTKKDQNPNPDPNLDRNRCYQMFAPGISRLGYTDKGRIYSIICPQQGVHSAIFGTLNVEVTVTGTRGWVDETNRELAADMGVVAKIWFSPNACQGPIVEGLWNLILGSNKPFPSNKSQAITIITSEVGDTEQPIFSLNKGQSTGFPIPDFAKHYKDDNNEEKAWSVGNLNVQIDSIIKTGYKDVDLFNQFFLNIFNVGSHNMLQQGNVLSWNVWFTAPTLVDKDEWARHAWFWRASIESGNGPPNGEGTIARYYDGTPLTPQAPKIDEVEKQEKLEIEKVIDFLKKIESKDKDKFINFLKEKVKEKEVEDKDKIIGFLQKIEEKIKNK